MGLHCFLPHPNHTLNALVCLLQLPVRCLVRLLEHICLTGDSVYDRMCARLLRLPTGNQIFTIIL